MTALYFTSYSRGRSRDLCVASAPRAQAKWEIRHGEIWCEWANTVQRIACDALRTRCPAFTLPIHE
jgi:hypothetical protein